MRMHSRRSFVLVLVLLLAALGLTAPEASAAGFSIWEQGGRSMGFAGAYTAQTSDPSAIYFNAAGIAFLKGKHLYFGGTLVHPTSDFVGADPVPGAGVTEKGDVSVIPVPTFYYTHQFSENLVLGIGAHSPFGLKTQWADPDTYSGRFISQKADLKSLSLNPTLGYKLADRFAIGAGVDIRFSKVTLDRHKEARLVDPVTGQVVRIVDIASVNLESNYNTGIGFNVGLLAKPSDDFSIGAAYRHKVKVDYDGSATFTQIPTGIPAVDAAAGQILPKGAQAVTTSIEFPAIVNGGVMYTKEDWTLAADVVWYQWSTFSVLRIAFPDAPAALAPLLNQTVTENYKDSWQFRLGVERRLGDHWAVRGGYFFDQTPSPVESVGPLLPDADRNGLALGLSYKAGGFLVDAGSWYLMFKDRSTEGLNRDGYNGTYGNKALTFGLSIGYAF